MSDYVDLHLHTNHSDGSDPPEEVVRRAAAIGLRAIAITDHDTLAALPVARASALQAGIEYLDAVEISCRWNRQELHVLAYGIRTDDAPLNAALENLRNGRACRSEAITEKLRAIPISLPDETPWRRGGEDSPGRMHIARWLHELGLTRTVQEGFDRYLNPGRPAFVPKTLLPIEEGLDLIKQAGGCAVLAHPGLGSLTHAALGRLLALPLDGIEVYHISHKPGQIEAYKGIAADRGLLMTGGSDCHGAIKGSPEMGKVLTPYACYAALRDAIAARQSA